MRYAIVAVLALTTVLTANDSKPPASTTPDGSKHTKERVEVPPPPFTDGIFPCSTCHAGQKPDRTRRDSVDAHGNRAEARRRASMVPRLPRCRQSRLAAPGQRRAGALRRVVPALRPVPRRETSRLESGSPRPPHRKLERRTKATCSARTATTRTSRGSNRYRPEAGPDCRPAAAHNKEQERQAMDSENSKAQDPRGGSSSPALPRPRPAGS